MVLLFDPVVHERAYTYLINRSRLCRKCRCWLQNFAVMSFLFPVITIYCRISECYFTDRGGIVDHFALVSSSSFFILVRATPQVLAWCAGIASETVASRLPCWLRVDCPTICERAVCITSYCVRLALVFVIVCCFFLSVSTSYTYISIFIKTGVIVVVIFVK